MLPRSMLPRFRRSLLLAVCCACCVPFLGGCALFEVPDHVTLDPTPTPPPNKPVFDPAAATTTGTLPVAGVPLNALNSAEQPDAYRAVRAEIEVDPPDTGEHLESNGATVLFLQTVDTPPVAPGATPGGTPRAPVGIPTPNATQLPVGTPRAPSIIVTPAPRLTPLPRGTPSATMGVLVAPGAPLSPGQVLGPKADPVSLAGIVLPTNEPFRTAALNTLQTWMTSGDLDVEQDKIYPFDLRGRARVQVFFKGRTEKTKTTRYNLNRLMVRSGFAVVDLYSPTTLDTQLWLADEQVARGLATGSTPSGLWKDANFSIAQRAPVVPTPTPLPTGTPGTPMPGTTSSGPLSNTAPRKPAPPSGKPATTIRSRTTATTRTTTSVTTRTGPTAGITPSGAATGKP